MVKLSTSSVKKYASVLSRLHKADISVSDALAMSDKQLQKELNVKNIKSVKALKRNIKSLTIDDGRKEKIIKTAKESYKKFGYTGKGLQKIEKELTQVIPKAKVKEVITELPEIGEIPKKEKGNYGIMEVFDKDGNSYWIKYDDKKSFDTQMDILKEKYKFSKSPESSMVFHGYQPYVPYVDKQITNFL